MLDKIKNHPICATIVTLTAVYGVIAGIYLNLDGKYNELQNVRIADAEKYKPYQNQFHEISLKCKEIELKHIALKSDHEGITSAYNKLKDCKWEEQFYAEKISYRALKEEFELTKKRYDNEIAGLQKRNGELYSNNTKMSAQINNSLYSSPKQVSETVFAFDQLLKEKDKLISEVRRLSLELEQKNQVNMALQDKLKINESIQLELQALIKKNGLTISNYHSPVDALIASIKTMNSDTYAAQAIVAGVKSIKGGVSGTDFCRIIRTARFSSDAYAVAAIAGCAEFVNTSISPQDISSILDNFSSNAYQSQASQIIMSINAK